VKDSVVAGTVAGIIGSLFLNLFTYLALLAGISTSTPWDVAALVFLQERFLGTTAGYIIGFTGSLAMGVATGLVTSAVLSLTGSDYGWLKGVLVAEGLGFATLGFVAPLIGIGGFLKSEPVTNIFAMVSLFIFGSIVGSVTKRFLKLNQSQ